MLLCTFLWLGRSRLEWQTPYKEQTVIGQFWFVSQCLDFDFRFAWLDIPSDFNDAGKLSVVCGRGI